MAGFSFTATGETHGFRTAPNAKINDLNETLDWVVKEGYATEAELEAVEEEGN